jgi:hypothetical protein
MFDGTYYTLFYFTKHFGMENIKVQFQTVQFVQ